MKIINIKILGKNKVFGLEESEKYKLSSFKCVTNDSKNLDLDHFVSIYLLNCQ